MRSFGRGSGHFWVGKLVVSWPVRNDGGPLLDGCSTMLTDEHAEPYPRRYHFGGVVIRPLRIAVGWRGARTPNPGRWLKPSFVFSHVRWVLRGRPEGRVRDLFPVARISSDPIEYDRDGFQP